jgi:hypothetical protein
MALSEPNPTISIVITSASESFGWNPRFLRGEVILRESYFEGKLF